MMLIYCYDLVPALVGNSKLKILFNNRAQKTDQQLSASQNICSLAQNEETIETSPASNHV